MRKLTAGTALAAIGLWLPLAGGASAADLATEPAAPVPPAVVEPGVAGSLTLYGWLPWMDGQAGVDGTGPVDVSLDPHDILEKLNMAFMAAGDIRWGPVGLFGDLIYMDIGASQALPGPDFSNAEVGLTMTIGTVAGTYQVYESGNDWLQVMGGARFWNIEGSLDLSGGAAGQQSADATIDWVDPMVGLRGRKFLDDKWFLAGTGLIGGFGVGSELSWDVFAGIGYQFNESFSMSGGYRALGVDYDQNGDVIDLVSQGPMFALTFNF